jgi:hypothetical protein
MSDDPQRLKVSRESEDEEGDPTADLMIWDHQIENYNKVTAKADRLLVEGNPAGALEYLRRLRVPVTLPIYYRRRIFALKAACHIWLKDYDAAESVLLEARNAWQAWLKELEELKVHDDVMKEMQGADKKAVDDIEGRLNALQMVVKNSEYFCSSVPVRSERTPAHN